MTLTFNPYTRTQAASDADASRFTQETTTRQLFRLGIVLAGLGFATPALAQSYDDTVGLDADSGTNCRAVAGQADVDGSAAASRGTGVPAKRWNVADGREPRRQHASVSGRVLSVSRPMVLGPPLFIGAGVSFIFVDRFHHHSHFDHFHQMGHMRIGAPMGPGFHGGPSRFGGGLHGLWGGHRR